jgi:hypothetical protein
LFAIAAAFAACLLHPPEILAQTAAAPPVSDDPFARRSWNLELSSHIASETWNYNTSREEMYGITVGLTYGLGKGIVLTARAPLYYVNQRGIDGALIGVTTGVRGRIYRYKSTSFFVEVDVGISEADTLVPPRGTRFNYLALGSGGATIRLAAGVHMLATMRWAHVSNGGLAGRSRNPDIEAVGPQLGVLVGF